MPVAKLGRHISDSLGTTTKGASLGRAPPPRRGLKSRLGLGEPERARSEERITGASAQAGGLERTAGVGIGVEEDKGLGGLPVAETLGIGDS
ncbi:hypothetical protein [Singulisphaera sp. GP187]|uniref:hypothetical protein n=1 Tax=Singulisphaera sp. GP187 TaxID=1882752 RepID=UPI0011614B8B|nr:hypothetical protein [Singulisphaera sp. GP187]